MLVISINDADDADHVCQLIAPELPPGSVQQSGGSRGFDGTITNDIVILAAMVSPVLIKHVAEVLIGLIGAKSAREVSVNGVSLKGYSAEDAAALLRASAGQPDASSQPAA